MGIIIRRAEVGDKKILQDYMDKLDHIRQKLFTSSTVLFHKRKVSVSYSFKKKDIIFVAQVKNTIVGFCYGTIEKRPNHVLSKMGYLEEIYVDKSARGMNVGKKLFQALIHEFKQLECDHMITHTDFENKSAQEFYDSIGMHKATLEYWKKL